MADNINFNPLTGRHSFFTVREPAWHNLGKMLDSPPTSAEAIIHAGLDYTVAKTPVYAHIAGMIGEGGFDAEQQIGIENRFATYRTDTNDIFGIVSDRYQIVQNREAFGFFDAIVGDGQAIYETAGALGKGETIFITARLPGHIKVANDDDIMRYLLLTMAHDGSKSITAMFTPIRVVCANTLASALAGSNGKVFVKHTGNVKYNLEQAHVVLGITKRLSESLQVVLNIFAKEEVSEKEAQDIIKQAFLTEEELTSEDETNKISPQKQGILDSVWNYYHNGLGQARFLGTLYGLYNAVSGYYQNVKDFKTDSSKFSSIFQGEGQRITQLVFNKCLTIAKERGKL